ncbi:unnamed protein product [Penicillium olsonii]|nr:unnamed protein product [Penicillium olsonii]
MPRTSIRLRADMTQNTKNLQGIWRPLNLHNGTQQDLADRQAVISVIRDVYDPMLTQYLAAGNLWTRQFLDRAPRELFRQLVALQLDSLPGSVRHIEEDAVLTWILYDLLRFYRFTDVAWRTPRAPAKAPAKAPAEAPANAPTAAPAKAKRGLATRTMPAPVVAPAKAKGMLATRTLPAPVAAPAVAATNPLNTVKAAVKALVKAVVPDPALTLPPMLADSPPPGPLPKIAPKGPGASTTYAAKKRRRSESDDSETEEPARKRPDVAKTPAAVKLAPSVKRPRSGSDDGEAEGPARRRQGGPRAN